MTELRVATFNIENLDTNNKHKASIQRRINYLRPLLLQLNADILCLQEINSQVALEQLLENTPYAYYAIASTQNDPSKNHKMAQDCVVLSKYSIRTSEAVFNKYDSASNEGNYSLWTRAFLHCTIEIAAGRLLHVLNIHLKSKNPVELERPYAELPGEFVARDGLHLSELMRTGQATEIRRFINTLVYQDPQCALLVCGDFNATSDEKPYQIISGIDQLEPALQACCEHPQSALSTAAHKQRIDHILASSQLHRQLVGSENHPELEERFKKLMSNKKISTKVKSDHIPLVAVFALG